MVSVQEVPKRADRNPNTTFYLWTIKHDQVGVTLELRQLREQRCIYVVKCILLSRFGVLSAAEIGFGMQMGIYVEYVIREHAAL